MCDKILNKKGDRMDSREMLLKIRKLSNKEKRELDFEQLKKIMEYMTPDEIIELSNIIGYPVFTRLCMGVLQHKFVLLQDGAAAIIISNEGKILLQYRSDKGLWGLPGGCQELGESFKDTIIREVKEETNLNTLEIIDMDWTFRYNSLGDDCIEHAYLSIVDDGKVILNFESIDYKWLSFDEFIEKIDWFYEKDELILRLKDIIKKIK